MKHSWHLLPSLIIFQATWFFPVKASIIPPFPNLEPPYDQAEWEKTLPLSQQQWIQKTEKAIELKEAHQKKHFSNYECTLILDRNGRFSGSPFFSDQKLPEKEKLIKRIQRFHFPSLPEGMETAWILLRVDPNSKVAIRFLKSPAD